MPLKPYEKWLGERLSGLEALAALAERGCAIPSTQVVVPTLR